MKITAVITAQTPAKRALVVETRLSHADAHQTSLAKALVSCAANHLHLVLLSDECTLSTCLQFTARIATTLSGHKTRSVFDRYDIVSEVDLVQATQKLQFHLGRKPEQPKVVTTSKKRARENENTDNSCC